MRRVRAQQVPDVTDATRPWRSRAFSATFDAKDHDRTYRHAPDATAWRRMSDDGSVCRRVPGFCMPAQKAFPRHTTPPTARRPPRRLHTPRSTPSLCSQHGKSELTFRARQRLLFQRYVIEIFREQGLSIDIRAVIHASIFAGKRAE